MAELVVFGIGYEGNSVVIDIAGWNNQCCLRDAYFALEGWDDEYSIAEFASSVGITSSEEFDSYDWLSEIQGMDSADFVLQAIWDADKKDWFYVEDDTRQISDDDSEKYEWEDIEDYMNESMKKETKSISIQEALKMLRKPLEEKVDEAAK